MDLFKIGEIAKLKDISVQALRLYDKEGIFIPAHVDEESKYRYYSADQFFLLEIITFLREVNLPIKNIKNMIEDNSLEAWLNYFEIYKREIEEEIKSLIQKKRNIVNFQNHINDIIKSKENEKYYIVKHEKLLVLDTTCPSKPFSTSSINKFHQLYSKVSKHNLGTTYVSGSILKKEPQSKTYVFDSIFVNILKANDIEHKKIPQGYFLCINTSKENLDTTIESVSQFLDSEKIKTDFIFLRNAYLNFVDYTQPFFILQVPLEEDEIDSVSDKLQKV